MSENKTVLKVPSRRHWPRGLSILHEDRDILVVDKVSGLLTMGTEKVKENTAYYLLREYVRKGNRKSQNRVYIVHRLDRDTSGIILFAKTPQAKRYLQDNWHDFEKTYYAVVHGAMKEKEGLITSYLEEDSTFKMHSTSDDKKGKLARTGYKVVKETELFSLLEVALLTGRKNQIRVHLADKGCPVFADKRYGVKEKGKLALHAAKLTITHPHSKQKMTFEAKVPDYFDELMRKTE
ncbi:MAG: RluA family pseudouridine synthase [Candidatus Sabulitectum sp.]|nr:RluA family pseudouridine synthase [Candidatus Sabulitectum sp.]